MDRKDHVAMAFADAEDDRSSGGGWVGVGGRFSVGTLADGCVCHLVPGSCGIVQPSARVRNGDGRGRRWVKRLVAVPSMHGPPVGHKSSLLATLAAVSRLARPCPCPYLAYKPRQVRSIESS